MLIHIFRPVMEYHGAWESEFDDGGESEIRGFRPEDRPPVLNDLALSAHYPVDPQLEAIASQDRWNRDPVRILKSLHVLHRIQETWLVKFTTEVSAHDTWGRAFLNKLQGFDDELQILTTYIHNCVTSTPMVNAGQYDDASPSHLWDNTAMKFFCLLLFLFDVGITPEAEQYEYYDEARFHESPAFCCNSGVRSRILANAAFMTHLELCAWKVLTVSWGIRSPYEWHRLAIPEVCAELRVRIVAIRQKYAVKVTMDRRRSAIKLALDWRSEWESESGDAGGMQKRYKDALATLQNEHAVKLAFILRDQPKNVQPESSELKVARLLKGFSF
jgi:hypothetical protein